MRKYPDRRLVSYKVHILRQFPPRWFFNSQNGLRREENQVGLKWHSLID